MSKVSAKVVNDFSPKNAQELLDQNEGNRPYRSGIANRYAEDILRGKWQLNGETIVVDSKGHLASGQHRCHALIIAEEKRKKDVEYYRENYGWKGPIKIPVIIVTGTSEASANTLDIGQKRTGADVLYRQDIFNRTDNNYEDRDFKNLSKILAGSARLVWMRLGGKKVSDAPHFPHSEMLDFVDTRDCLLKLVQHTYEEDQGDGSDSEAGRRVSNFISPAYLAGLVYLFAHASNKSEVDKPKMMEKAEQFVVLFASGANLDAKNPILVLRNYLIRADKGEHQLTRDAKIGIIIKAWNAWIDGTLITAKDLKLKKVDGDIEFPRIGGIDIELEEDEVDEVEETEAQKKKREKVEAKAKKKADAKAEKDAKVKAKAKKKSEKEEEEDEYEEDEDEEETFHPKFTKK